MFDSDFKVWNHGNQNIILSSGCQQPFLVKMASDNRLSAAVFGPKWLVTTGCQQPLPIKKSAKMTSLSGEFIYLELNP